MIISFIAVLIVVLPYGVCAGINGFEEIREVMLYLNEDGSLKQPGNLPDCGNRKINIVGSAKLKLEDHHSMGWQTYNEELLSEADEYKLHISCSWRQKCMPDLKFQPIQQNQMTNAVKIKFMCLGISPASDFVVNMCISGIKFFSERRFLTIDESFTKYRRCECHLNYGQVSVDVNDLIFINKNDLTRCTSAKLLINNDYVFNCSKDLAGFGSVFNKKVIKSADKGFIGIKSFRQQEIPAMLMMLLSPEGNASIECIGRKPWATNNINSREFSNSQTDGLVLKPTTNTTKLKPLNNTTEVFSIHIDLNQSDSSVNNNDIIEFTTNDILIPIGAVTLTCSTLACSLVCFRSVYRKRHKREITKSTDEESPCSHNDDLDVD